MTAGRCGTIRGFFESVGNASLLLPDGWFGGRPMEGLHSLTYLAERPRRVLVELDEQLLLVFSGDPEVYVAKTQHALSDGTSTLIVRSFRQCVFEWLEYGNCAPHVSSYTSGLVSLVAPD